MLELRIRTNSEELKYQCCCIRGTCTEVQRKICWVVRREVPFRYPSLRDSWWRRGYVSVLTAFDNLFHHLVGTNEKCLDRDCFVHGDGSTRGMNDFRSLGVDPSATLGKHLWLEPELSSYGQPGWVQWAAEWNESSLVDQTPDQGVPLGMLGDLIKVHFTM